MIARIRTLNGNLLYIDTDDLAYARRRRRKLMPIRDSKGRRKSIRGEGDLLLHVDNIATGGDPP